MIMNDEEMGKQQEQVKWNKSKIINTKNISFMSQKILKFQSLLSFSSLSSLSPNKKLHLKPLQLSDIIVVMVQEQLSVDKTKQLKSYLTKNRKNTISLDPQEELIQSPLNNMPEFAKKQWGFAQLLRYHIQRKRPNVNEDIAFYQKKLAEIEHQFSNSLEKYKYQLQEGKNAIQQIQSNINSLYQTTLISKKHINESTQKIKGFNKKILKNVRKQQNISKTIAIAKAWNKSKISKILSQNLNSIQSLDINNIMAEIDNCSKEIKLQGANKQLQNSDKVIKVIEERRNMIIDKVQKNMLFSIINFTDQQRYERIYNQYNDLLKSLAWSDEEKFKEYHQLEKVNLQGMIQENLDHIYWSSLQQVSTISNIELLREETYTAFFSKLIQNYNSYLVKWHKVTSFHVNADTPHKDNCMKMMEDVASKIVKKVFHLVKYSQKFFSLSFSHKVKLILEVDKLVEFLQEWTGKKDLSLFQVLKEKFKTEIDYFRKEINGYMKVLFVEEFSEEGLMPKIKRKFSGDEKEDSLPNHHKSVSDLAGEIFRTQKTNEAQKVRQIAVHKLFQQQIFSLQKTNEKTSASEQFKASQQQSMRFKQRIREITLYQTFDLGLSKAFVKSIAQYCEREQILPFGHLEYILEHFEFLILLIFKVCVYEDTKTKMIESFSQRAFMHLKTVEAAIEKNPADESLFHSLARMREAFIMRRNYLELHYFLSNQIDDKFDNLVISGFVNINKLYMDPNQNAEALNGYHSKVSKLIQELLKIARWLINSQSYFSQYERYTRKLQLLPNVIIQLGFLYFEQYNSVLYNKYLETIQPIMKNLKWKIQKFNNESTQSFREYKIGILQICRSSTLNIGIKDKELHDELTNKHLQVFYKALLHLYCKIDKINDNGRQVLRLDVMEISKILTEVGYEPGSWDVWFQKFIQSTMQRSIKGILERIQQLGIVYPITCWKSHLLWIVNNLSTKEKKQYTTHLLKIYADQLKQLPEL